MHRCARFWPPFSLWYLAWCLMPPMLLSMFSSRSAGRLVGAQQATPAVRWVLSSMKYCLCCCSEYREFLGRPHVLSIVWAMSCACAQKLLDSAGHPVLCRILGWGVSFRELSAAAFDKHCKVYLFCGCRPFLEVIENHPVGTSLHKIDTRMQTSVSIPDI